MGYFWQGSALSIIVFSNKREKAEHMSELTKSSRAAFASGGAVDGVFKNAHYFVLIYYSQVLGLDPGLTGFAVGLGLVFDAISDPLVGYLSDNTRSRWGRRHPWLVGSILPLSASFYFLWFPPGFLKGEAELFVWLVTCNVMMRLGVTMFMVPAYAMLAEISPDYDERSRLISWFQVLQFLFMNGMSIFMYAFWLVPTDEIADGIMNPKGYQDSGVVGTIVIVVACLIFTAGLRKYIPKLREYKVQTSPGITQFYRQILDVLKDRAARIVFGTGAMYYAGVGTTGALWTYIYSFFWGFNSQQLAIIVIPMTLSALLLPPILARLMVGREKNTVAAIGLIGAILMHLGPIFLYMLGLFPERGSITLFWAMFAFAFVETIFFVLFEASWRSMIADLTEQIELKTGRRNEGVIASSVTFASKCALALGTLIAGTLLSMIMFPTEASISDVPMDKIIQLGLIYAPVMSAFWIGGILLLRRHEITRERHKETLKLLAERK